MSAFYLLSDDGKPELNDEVEAISRMQQGTLSPDAYYWKEGMAEWKPLRELAPQTIHFVPARRDGTLASKLAQPHLSPAQPIAPATSISSRIKSSDYFLRKELQPWTSLLEIVILACMVIDSIQLWTYASRLSFVIEDPSQSEMGFYDLQNESPEWVLTRVGFILVKYILYSVWLYRSYKNCRGFTANIRFSSAWAVGYSYIPVLNLFRPCQVMQEVWKISTLPNRALGARNSVFVGFWWAVWLLQILTAVLLSHPPRDNFAVNIEAILTVYYGVAVVFAIMTFLLVHMIYLKQKRLTAEPVAPKTLKKPPATVRKS